MAKELGWGEGAGSCNFPTNILRLCVNAERIFMPCIFCGSRGFCYVILVFFQCYDVLIVIRVFIFFVM